MCEKDVKSGWKKKAVGCWEKKEIRNDE